MSTKIRILEMQEELESELKAMPPSEVAKSPMDIVDLSQHRSMQEEQERRRGELTDRLELIDLAITRMDHGTYRRCVACGRTIEKQRQEILPLTVLCREHADRDELLGRVVDLTDQS